MQIPSRFSIAIHICLCVEFFNEDSEFNKDSDKKHCKKMTGEALAESVGINSVIVRNILALLKNAGLISIFRGSNGARLTKSATQISLLDIFYAVESTPKNKDSLKSKNIDSIHKESVDTQEKTGYTLFRFHTNPNELCPLGKNIHSLLDSHFIKAQRVLEEYLASVKLSDLLEELRTQHLC
ncbi:MAG TPA: Rrf2 family transcriptional regulator [Campylobacter avium]|uniref:Rrf2 family transcriptional regulator n=1 Tax=Campylobacter avium TaxID=522485 RepID=UPI001D8DBFE9|nr:Rrf2 family transcriptional regulator [Campylobacter avium]HJE66280.1 Rrf2 family transcriptional regulator [Campylobacter avium]